ncbi:sigma-70 family RNA polymerase sigma factor [Cellulomonas sp. NPDC089187]|uniref:RNA polymerase sigma factor n=1 Tax=Cellulomonas sp. NPDC089187 TaxID=3154970 RepID=UPI0034410DCB
MTVQHEIAPDVADDLALCMAARGGDRAAFDALYRRHAPWARTVAVGMVGPHNADDLVSETFAALLSALRRGSGPVGGVRGYLRTAMRRQAGRLLAPTDDVVPSDGLSLLIVEGPEQEQLDLEVLTSAEDHVIAASDQAAVARAFAGLTERSRRAIELVDVEDKSYAEAAAELGMSVGSFGRALYLARHELFDAWVAEHVPEATGLGSHPDRLALAQQLIGSARPRSRARTAAHLATCADCRRRTELVDVVLTQPRRRAAVLGWLGLIPLWWARFRRTVHGRHLAGVQWGWPQFFGLGLAFTLVTGLTTFTAPPAAGPQVDTSAEVAAGSTAPTLASPLPGSVGIEVGWASGSSLTGSAAGDEVTLTFTLRATGEDTSPATLHIAATPGVEIVQPYSFCRTDAAGLTCPRLGPFSDGQVITGQLTVRVTDPAVAQLPALSVTRG